MLQRISKIAFSITEIYIHHQYFHEEVNYDQGENYFSCGKTCWQSKEPHQLDWKCCKIYEDDSNLQVIYSI